MKSKTISRILPLLFFSLMLGAQLRASEVEQKDSVVVADTNHVTKSVTINGKQIETATVRKDGKEEVHTSIVTDKGDTLKVKIVKLNADAKKDNASVSLSVSDDNVEDVLAEAFSGNWGSTTTHKDAKVAAVLIVLIVFGCIFGFPAIVIFLIFYFRHRDKKRRYDLIEKAIAAGQPIPEELVRRSGGAYVPSGNGTPEGDETRRLEILRNKGIRNIGVGVGLAILLGVSTDTSMASIGALVICIGISQVITYYIQTKKK